MGDEYYGIAFNFIIGYDNDKTNFKNKVKQAFSQAYNIGGTDGLNKTFIHILKQWTIYLDQFILMVEEGADPRYDDDMPFVITCRYSKSDIPRYLIEKYRVDISAHNNSAIAASHKNDPALLKTFLDVGIEIDTKLIISCLNNHEKLCMIIEKGADLNKILYYFVTSHTRQPEASAKILLEAIIENKFSSSFDADNLNKFLELQIEIFSLHLIKRFIQLGANPRHNRDFIFARSCGIQNQTTDIPLYFLNECGCDINAWNECAIRNAIVCDNFNLAKYLLDLGAQPSKSCIDCAINDGPKAVQFLLDNGISPDSIGEVYVKSMNLEIAKMLVNNGVSFDQLIMKNIE